MNRDIRHARQEVADINRDITALKAEALAIMKSPAASRTPTQTTRLNSIEAELETLTTRAAEAAAELAQFERMRDDEISQATLGGGDTQRRPSGRKWLELFPQAGLSMDGWSSSAEYMRVVGLGLHDSRLQAASMSGGDGSAGGNAIPPGIFGPWWNSAVEESIVASRATIWPMTSDTRTVPAWDVTDRSGNDLAGFEIQWTPELGTIDLQVGKIRKIVLKARKGAILAEASEELRADGLDFDKQLDAIMAKALHYGLDRSFLFGTGSNQPLGIFESAATIVVAKETGQAADTITYANLTSMFSRMAPGSIQRAVWIAHPSTIPQLSALSIPMGTAGAHVPVMTGSNGQFVILTRPVIFSEKLLPLGDEGDIALCDFGAYTIGMRSEVVIDRSQHVGFARDAMTYRLKVRLDGQPNLTTAITPPNSAPTLSPFVTLAAR